MKIKNCHKDEKTFKCENPKITLSKLEKAFDELGLDVEYTGRVFCKDTLYSGSLIIPSLNYIVNGKGISYELAKASAYSEMAERISCGFFNFFPVKNQSKKNLIDKKKLFDFYYFSYQKGYRHGRQSLFENSLKIENIFKKQGLSKKEVEKIKKSEVAQHWVNGYSLSRQKNIKVPLRLIHRISGTNGLASGNTLEEAIVHGANEVFERFILFKVVKEKKILPTIRISSIKDGFILKIIKYFKKNNIDIIIKDCSSDGHIPCIGILFINNNVRNSKNSVEKKTKYLRWYTEVSFNYKEAIIRCFTSYTQGISKVTDLKKSKSMEVLWKEWFSEFPLKSNDNKKYSYLSKKNFYEGDLGFLKKGGKVSIKNIQEGKETNDCVEEINKIKSICKFLGTELIVIDQTHPVLNFPAVRIIIPGVSDEMNAEYKDKFDIERITLPIEKYWTKEFYDFIISSKWTKTNQGIKSLIVEIEKYIVTFPFNFVIQTSGVGNRTINLFELLLSLYIKIGGDIKLVNCLNVLSGLYPDEEKLYKTLRTLATSNKIKEMKEVLKQTRGCYRFMLSQGNNNPFINWCDKSCENRCVRNFEINLKKLLKSFY